MQLELVIAPGSHKELNSLAKIGPESSVQVERHISGDAVVIITASLTAAASVLKSIEKIINGTRSVVKWKKIKIDGRSITLEGFDTDDALVLIDRLQGFKLPLPKAIKKDA